MDGLKLESSINKTLSYSDVWCPLLLPVHKPNQPHIRTSNTVTTKGCTISLEASATNSAESQTLMAILHSWWVEPATGQITKGLTIV